MSTNLHFIFNPSSNIQSIFKFCQLVPNLLLLECQHLGPTQDCLVHSVFMFIKYILLYKSFYIHVSCGKAQSSCPVVVYTQLCLVASLSFSLACSLLVGSGCHNRISYMEWFKQQKLISSQFWRLEVQDLGTSISGSGEGSLLGADSHLLTLSSQSRERDSTYSDLIYS